MKLRPGQRITEDFEVMYGDMAGHLRTVLVFAAIAVFGLAVPVITPAQGGKISSGTSVTSIAFHRKVVVETEIRDAKAAIDFWMKPIVQKYNSEYKGYIYDSLDSLHEDFKKGLLDWVIMAPNDYVLYMDDMEAQLGPIPVIGGKTSRNYYVVVLSNDSISGVGDLKGKVIAVAGENDAGTIYLNTLLLKNKMRETEEHFNKVLVKRTFSQAILAVFFGQADACITNDQAFNTVGELNPQIKKRLKILAASPAYVHAVSLFKKNVDIKIKTDIENEVRKLAESTEGRQVLMLFRIDGMVPVHESDLNPTIELMKEYSRLKGEAGLQQSASETKPR